MKIDRPFGLVPANPSLRSVACAPGGPCVVGDDAGNVIVSR
jgi:hypothetical protein